MATDIVQGLFGMTPESYQMQQQAAAREQAAKFASMDPFQQANYGLYLGGNQLGGALGGMMGAQDPMLQRISQQQELLKTVDPTNPESLAKAAQTAASSGNAQLATALAQKANELQASLVKQAQESAAAQASRASASKYGQEAQEIVDKRAAKNSRVQMLKDAGMSDSEAQAVASNDAAFAKIIENKRVATPAEYAVQAQALGFGAKPYLSDYTADQVTAMEKGVFAHKAGIAKAGALAVQIPLDKVFDKFWTQKASEEQAKDWSTQGQAFATIPATRQKLAEVNTLIDNSFTGTGANAKLGMAKLVRGLGLPIDVNKASDTEVVEALTTQFAVAELKKNFGSNPAVKDFEAQLKIKPGILQEPETFKRLVQKLDLGLQAEDIAYRQGEKWRRDNKGSIEGFNPFVARSDATTKLNKLSDLVNKSKSGKITDTEKAEAIKLQGEINGYYK